MQQTFSQLPIIDKQLISLRDFDDVNRLQRWNMWKNKCYQCTYRNFILISLHIHTQTHTFFFWWGDIILLLIIMRLYISSRLIFEIIPYRIIMYQTFYHLLKPYHITTRRFAWHLRSIEDLSLDVEICFYHLFSACSHNCNPTE